VDLAEQTDASLQDRLHRRLLRTTERRLIQSTPHLCALSDRLGRALSEISPGAKVDVIPLGMDLSLYPFRERPARTGAAPVVGMIGSFDWLPNYSSAVRVLERIWPELRKRIPGARLRIVGRSARQRLADRVGGATDIDLFENVPDILPHFDALDLLLYAPRSASGMKVKVMEAFALGAPVVTTPDGVEGLPAQDRVHAQIASDDTALVERVVELWGSPEQAERQRRAARALLESCCGLETTVDQVEAMYRRILSSGPVCPAG
jgi:glycosyltransferase involved in cell wall biosynthesis